MDNINATDYIKLSDLLQSIQFTIDQAYAMPVWVVAEIAEANTHARSGHTYLTLVELENNKQVARVRGTIWRSQYQNTVGRFTQATGAQLTQGVRILCQVKVQAHPLYGLSVNVFAINPVFTLGDIEQKKQQIRQQLLQEGVSGLNQQLPNPIDIFRVAVIAPFDAAGLGDFNQEAKVLEQYGIVKFQYFHAVFQGEQVIPSFKEACGWFLGEHASESFDLLVIIRGGGAALDLNYLNEVEIARFVATAPLPVWTGIGHERDSTLLDEQAHAVFDTPSKAGQGIINLISTRALSTSNAINIVTEALQSHLTYYQEHIAELNENILYNANVTLELKKQNVQSYEQIINLQSQSKIKLARQQLDVGIDNIKTATHYKLQGFSRNLTLYTQQVMNTASSLFKLKQAAFKKSTEAIGAFATIKHQQLAEKVKGNIGLIKQQALMQVDTKQNQLKLLAQLVVLNGPAKILERGFAMIKNDKAEVLKGQKVLPGDQIIVETQNQILDVTVNKERKNG